FIFYVVDRFYYAKEPAAAIANDNLHIEPIKIEGKINFIYLTGVVLAVAFLNEQYLPAIKEHHFFGFIREGVILIMVVLSLLTGNNNVRYIQNKFSWGPIVEVSYLFF